MWCTLRGPSYCSTPQLKAVQLLHKNGPVVGNDSVKSEKKAEAIAMKVEENRREEEGMEYSWGSPCGSSQLILYTKLVSLTTTVTSLSPIWLTTCCARCDFISLSLSLGGHEDGAKKLTLASDDLQRILQAKSSHDWVVKEVSEDVIVAVIVDEIAPHTHRRRRRERRNTLTTLRRRRTLKPRWLP